MPGSAGLNWTPRTSPSAGCPERTRRSGQRGGCILRLLGRLCGDLALTFLATGGVYIGGGGIVPRILDVLNEGAFRQAFEHKPPFSDRMKQIPTCVITIADPALAASRRSLPAGAVRL